MFHTFTRAHKRAFDQAFREGLPVSIAKDAAWARENGTFVGRGFTNQTVADPYQDGPSRPGEAWFYWVAMPGTETPVSAVEFHHTADTSWRFYCAICEAWMADAVRANCIETRDAHELEHANAPIVPSSFDTYPTTTGTLLHVYDGDRADAITAIRLSDERLVALLHELAVALELNGKGEMSALGSKLQHYTEAALS